MVQPQVAARARIPVPHSGYRRALATPSHGPLSPPDAVDDAEAARILGCRRDAVRQVVAHSWRRPSPAGAILSRVIVEDVATEVYPWRQHRHDPASYWVTGQQAADALGLSRARVNQLAATRRLRYVRHQDGTRLFRRHDLEALAPLPAAQT